MARTNQAKFGRAKEKKVAQRLRSKGASVDLSAASRGAADLTATFPSGTKWAVQVKATRKGAAASPSAKDTGRLKQKAAKQRATAVVAKVSPRGIVYESARTGRALTPPGKKRK